MLRRPDQPNRAPLAARVPELALAQRFLPAHPGRRALEPKPDRSAQAASLGIALGALDHGPQPGGRDVAVVVDQADGITPSSGEADVARRVRSALRLTEQ